MNSAFKSKNIFTNLKYAYQRIILPAISLKHYALTQIFPLRRTSPINLICGCMTAALRPMMRLLR